MKPTALFCISSLGLGHVMRTLPIIRSYLPTHDIHIASYGNALEYVRKDLIKENNVTFYEMKDYPPLERGKGWKMYWYILIDSLSTIFIIKREHSYVQFLTQKIKPQFIFSDGRYGSYIDCIPSFILSHQIRFVMPRGLGMFQMIADHFNYKTFKNFDTVLIPDFEEKEGSLAGNLSHHRMLKKLDHRYIGPLSALKKEAGKQDIDFLFVISGYLLEHKESFVSKLVDQAKKLPGKKVFILGNAKDDSKQTLENGTIEIYGSAVGAFKQDLFNRAKYVVSRSGYTTIMDLVELEKPGFLIPTPGQTEQEYLAEHLKDRFFTASAETFDLTTIDVQAAAQKNLSIPWKTDEAVRIAHEIIQEGSSHSFFSIVIPVHNEEKYLDKTLIALKDFAYPKNFFEVIIVENGSSDKTYDIARSYESWGFKTFVSEKGASKAKNFGAGKVSEKSDWIIFLDADTFLKPTFLADLNCYLRSKPLRDLSVGTTTVLPDTPDRMYANAWFAFYNAGHMLTKTSFAIQIMNARYREQVKFDENKTFTEDLKLIKDLRKLGGFFYFQTRTVLTSTRRFDEVGWFKLFFKWNWQALVLTHMKKEVKPYDVIR